MTKSWEERAREKREAILAAIPKEWRIENPPVEKQVDVTGTYVQQFLSKMEIEITETSADEIVKKTVSGLWSAEEVTRAFCHRAALAHQLVTTLPLKGFPTIVAQLIISASLPPRDLLRRRYRRRKSPRRLLR